MGTTWTDEQRQVIDSRNADLLVSAAAGSGKTAVLVERILELVTDPEAPTDIDRLLVVTFTRAAAAEMRERIGKALDQRLSETPDDLHLQRQSTLLQHAQISTIHSFCTTVIQNYSHLTDLDPSCRVADEGELRMLQGKVMKEFLENEYLENAEDFHNFAEAFSPGRTDSRLEALIRKVYEFSVSDPDPERWLDSVLEGYAVTTEEELMALPWMIFLREETGRLLEGALETAGEDLRLAELPQGPESWIPVMRQDLETAQQLKDAGGFASLQQALQELAFARLPAKKAGPDEDPEIREKIKEKREGLKKSLQMLRDDCYAMTVPEILEELSSVRPYACELVRLVKGYAKAYAAAKQKKNICDFSDLEHYALSILLEKDENGAPRPSQAARELAGQYDEIMIDEYQDSNYIQEALLSAVAGAGRGKHNRFMVGDIKQSIYGFRNARPELFLDKYRRYDTGNGNAAERRIDLHRNFRSRPQVLQSVNILFRDLMQESLGGITYDDSAALYPGAVYPDAPVIPTAPAAQKSPYVPNAPDAPAPQLYATELLLTASADPESGDAREKSRAVETEAAVTACRIRELMGTLQVRDDKNGGLRPLQYRDCVVLLRSAAGWADTFVRVLKDSGIPAYTLSREGYFSAVEVVTVLNCLRITDNPRQEIPFTAVLRSPAAGCTDADLAQLAVCYPQLPVYEAAERAAEDAASPGSPGGVPAPLAEKLRRFLTMLEGWREEAPVIPVHDLIRKVMEESGYGDYAAAMPAGAQREANLRMLLEKAVIFEQTDSGGLFSFIRYIERMQKYSVDDGEVSLYSEAEDIVRVTTIHKSKGLEYPVVFVSGLGKRFNMQDQNSSMVLHPGFGIGLYAPDLELRVRRSTLLRQAIRMAGVRDLLSEELRILYVAMTRAKEKLILTGTVKDTADLPEPAEELTYRQLSAARSPLDWILRSAAFLDDTNIRLFGAPGQNEKEGMTREDAGTFREVLADVLERGEAAAVSPEARALASFLERMDAFRYPYEEAAKLPAKMTVTEIKKASLEAMMEEKGEDLYPEEAVIPYIPRFMRETVPEKAAGAARGTIYHHVMELMDYGKLPEAETPENERKLISGLLDEMEAGGRLKEAEREAVDPADLQTFLHTEIGRRMKKASAAGKLRRESPFVLDIPAKEIDKSWPEEENILVQGVIDAWFEEDGACVIVDYKTDRVFSSDGRELAEKYAPQLLLYRRALESLAGVRVTEMILYSFALGKEIRIEERVPAGG